MKFKKIRYFIDQSYGTLDGRIKEVKGYAIDFEPVHLCVRKESRGWWTVDHYETGLGILIPFYIYRGSKETVALAAIEKVVACIKNGSYQAALQRYEARRAA